MVEEAGGVVTRFDGSPIALTADEVVAANPALHARCWTCYEADVASCRPFGAEPPGLAMNWANMERSLV